MKVTLETEKIETEGAAFGATTSGTSVATNLAAEVESLKVENATLKLSLEAATNSSILAQAKALNASAELDSLRTAQATLVDIVRDATTSLILPLGGSADSVSQMTVNDLIVKHAEVSKTFKSNFRAGGISQPLEPEVAVSPEKSWMSAMVGFGPQARKAAITNRK